MVKRCYCCSGASYSDCCEPFLTGARSADNAEQLMRSRFSAYCTANYPYILDTYGEVQRQKLTVDALADSAQGSVWFGLEVVEYRVVDDNNQQVEFIATYAEKGNTFVMHEVSQFQLQQSQWRYTTGQMQPDTGKVKISRNDPCPCQSSKKFKQCCLKRI